MVTADSAARPRPYWHIDAKWLIGILAFLSIGASLALYNLSALTGRDTAVNLSATVIAQLFSKYGLDDPRGLEGLRKQAAHTKARNLHPLPQFPSVTISKRDALTLGPAALRIAIFSQITGQIYDHGLDAAAHQLTPNAQAQQQFISQASPLGALTEANHELLNRMWLSSLLVSLLLFGGLIYFSAGWGRLVSPGVAFLVVSPLGAVAGLLLATLANTQGLPAGLPPNVALAVSESLRSSYLLTFMLGVGLLILAFLGKLISRLIEQNRSVPATS